MDNKTTTNIFPLDFEPVIPKELITSFNPILSALTDIQILDCAREIYLFNETKLVPSQSILYNVHTWYNKQSPNPLNFYSLLNILQNEINRRFINTQLQNYSMAV